jgi:hypothetical protein
MLEKTFGAILHDDGEKLEQYQRLEDLVANNCTVGVEK